MPAVDRYDIVVVGSGEAGKYLAWTLSKAGNRTALIERRTVGGDELMSHGGRSCKVVVADHDHRGGY
jgi:pyruvate/2-oxoglutarate dehydrogenase complex dihydrolipoamide dehydrogenase (E3) component